MHEELSKYEKRYKIQGYNIKKYKKGIVKVDRRHIRHHFYLLLESLLIRILRDPAKYKNDTIKKKNLPGGSIGNGVTRGGTGAVVFFDSFFALSSARNRNIF